MNILEYAKYKKMFGGSGGSGAQAYHLTSADELPTDAVDGSLAVVGGGETIYILNEELTTGNSKFSATFSYYDEVNYKQKMCVAIQGKSVNGERYLTYHHDDGTTITVYMDGWEDEFYRKITVPMREVNTNIEFHKFLDDHASVSDETAPTTLYSRENGEWVSKGVI